MAPHRPPSPPPIRNNYITGSLVAGVVILVVLLCLLYLVRRLRPKVNKKRDAAHFRVKGIIRPATAKTNFSSAGIPPFSRNGITTSVIMPEKSITRKPHYDRQSEKTDSVITPSRTSSSLSTLHPSQNLALTPPRSPAPLAHSQHHRSSSGFSGYTQYRFPPRLNRTASSVSFAPPPPARPVHQPFEPTLSDELAPKCGEYLTVLWSFDDGWCAVARDTSRSFRASLLSLTKHNGDVEIGLVPAWVFSKPLEGVASKRPFRNTSLNALQFAPNPADRRGWITSWSAFG